MIDMISDVGGTIIILATRLLYLSYIFHMWTRLLFISHFRRRANDTWNDKSFRSYTFLYENGRRYAACSIYWTFEITRLFNNYSNNNILFYTYFTRWYSFYLPHNVNWPYYFYVSFNLLSKHYYKNAIIYVHWFVINLKYFNIYIVYICA